MPKHSPKPRLISTQKIITAFTEQHLTMRQIGKLYNLSAPAISKRLQKAGITSDKGEWINTKCSFCSKPLQVPRHKWKKFTNHYCNTDCRALDLSSPESIKLKQGQRLARVIIRTYFPDIQPENPILHKDGNDFNNDRANLLVFKNQAELMAYLQGNGSKVKPIWEGDK